MPTIKKILILKNGRKFPVVEDNGVFWICENTKFRKNNPHIKEIKNIKPKKEERGEK